MKDVLAHLRVVANPRDAVSWHRVLLLLDGARPAHGRRPARTLGGAADLDDATERLAAYPRRGAYTKDLGRLADAAARARHARRCPPASRWRAWSASTRPMLRHMHPRRLPEAREGPRALRHHRERATGASPRCSPTWRSSRRPTASATCSRRSVDEGLLTLSTIHSAKGLEWQAVFVIWMVDGRFPSYHNLHDDEEVEEERRLLYVAVTRAKEHLYLIVPDRHLRPELGHGARQAVALRRGVAGGHPARASRSSTTPASDEPARRDRHSRRDRRARLTPPACSTLRHPPRTMVLAGRDAATPLPPACWDVHARHRTQRGSAPPRQRARGCARAGTCRGRRLGRCRRARRLRGRRAGSRRLRRGARPIRRVGGRRELWQRLAAGRERRLAALRRRPLGVDGVRVDLDRARPVGVDLSLRAVGVSADPGVGVGTRQRVGTGLGRLVLRRRLRRLGAARAVCNARDRHQPVRVRARARTSARDGSTSSAIATSRGTSPAVGDGDGALSGRRCPTRSSACRDIVSFVSTGGPATRWHRGAPGAGACMAKAGAGTATDAGPGFAITTARARTGRSTHGVSESPITPVPSAPGARPALSAGRAAAAAPAGGSVSSTRRRRPTMARVAASRSAASGSAAGVPASSTDRAGRRRRRGVDRRAAEPSVAPRAPSTFRAEQGRTRGGGTTGMQAGERGGGEGSGERGGREGSGGHGGGARGARGQLGLR